MKKWILPPLLLAVGVTLSGCSMGNVGSAAPTTAPMTAKPTMTIAAVSTPQPTASADTAGGATTGMATASPQADKNMAAAMTPAEAGKIAERISEAVERLSEVDDAEVIVSENRALVGVEFDDQYSAGLDERMKRMITETVQEIDEKLTDVRITDDDTIYGQVKSLGERMAKATGLDELASDFGDLWDRVTGM